MDSFLKSVKKLVKSHDCDYRCNAKWFKQNFNNWTSGNKYIDKFIQNTQLSAHYNYSTITVLEWIPYDRFYNIRYLTGSEIDKVYSANWIDGNIDEWNEHNQNWRRNNQNMFVTLKNLSNSASITLKFINEITEPYKIYGITQDPETKSYMALLAHDYSKKTVLEWIPYDRFYNIRYLTENEIDKVYSANWIDGNIDDWNTHNQNWRKNNQNMFVTLKNLSNSASITLKFINEITEPYKIYGITQNPETKNYIIVLDTNKCKNCENKCNAIYFQYNFNNWTSGNNDIDKFIQDTQLSDHNYNKCHALEWIPYNKFRDIKYIAKGGFGKVYKANWIDGYMDKWDDNHNSWKRKDQNMLVALKSLNNSKNVTLEFMNEITLHYKVNMHKSIIRLYGITQEPQTGNYIMVLDYAENGNLRDYLNTSYNELSWNNKLNYLHSIAHGLKNIHEKELIHRDLHIVPQLIVQLIKKCLDANPLNRPKAGEIKATLSQLFRSSHQEYVSDDSGIKEQIEEAERINNKLSTGSTFSISLGISYETHSEAIYTSRLLDFDNLPQPKNSDDYYEVRDNIISMKFSESLQIDTFKLNYNNLDLKNSDNTNTESSEGLQIDIPEPENPVDYYEENNNIINMESSESLQIDISQLNINEDGKYFPYL
ncbi:kinase-like domain-containing protein [Rhizophagus clarus]|uniref:Kinase-like domain-containing protein n=1 Tax=Rhizophagus clarus TaxID=94130 RepID=A0A8H3KQ33_9GLOM|nr:kinase-like domain-containing protein [Rhizophagus clarus]